MRQYFQKLEALPEPKFIIIPWNGPGEFCPECFLQYAEKTTDPLIPWLYRCVNGHAWGLNQKQNH